MREDKKRKYRIQSSVGKLGIVLCLLGSLAFCHAGHPWLTVRTNRGGAFPVRAADLSADGPASFDVVVGMDANPADYDREEWEQLREQWERIFAHFSDAVFESTEGVHTIRSVSVFTDYFDTWGGLPVDITIEQTSDLDVGPRANLNGLWRSSDQIWMYGLVRYTDRNNVVQAEDFMNDANGEDIAGFTLAHEWGHYSYGLGDEYARDNGVETGCTVAQNEMAVFFSIMNDQRLALTNTGTLRPQHLNFSIANSDQRVSFYENTGRNLQHAIHEESCWETLARDSATDNPVPCDDMEPRHSFGELRQAAIPPGSDPILQLPNNTPANPPEIIWMDTERVVLIALDKSGSMTNTIERAKAAAKQIVNSLRDQGDDYQIGVVAFDHGVTVISEPILLDSDQDAETVRTAIETIEADGGTSIRAGVEEAVAQMTDDKDKLGVIYLITDGRDEAVMDASEPAREARIPVFSLSFGDASGAKGLKELSEETGGEFKADAGLASSITRFFRELLGWYGDDPIGEGFESIAPGSSRAGSFLVEEGAERLVVETTLGGPPDQVTITLEGPGGASVQPTDLADLAGETAARFVVPDPAAGRWELVMRNDAAAGTVTGEFSARQKHRGFPIRLIEIPDDDPSRLPAVLRVRLEGPTSLAGAVVEGQMVAPSGAMTNLVFRDDGQEADGQTDDGIYSSFFTPIESGPHVLRATGDNRHGTLQTSYLLAMTPHPEGGGGGAPVPEPIDRQFERATMSTVTLLAPGRAPSLTLVGEAQHSPFFSADVTVSDPDTPAWLLQVNARSLDPLKLPDSLLTVRNVGAPNRWRITAAPVVRDVAGTVEIELSVSDGHDTATHLFTWDFDADHGEANTLDGSPTGEEEEMRWLVNRLRFDPPAENLRQGSNYPVPAGPLPPVAPNDLITATARKHSEDMGVTNTFQHKSPDGSLHYQPGSSAGDRLQAEGYSWTGYTENIAAGHPDSAAAHNGLFHSAGHRANMLKVFITEVGMGYRVVPGSAYQRYYTQTFATMAEAEALFTGTLFLDADNDNAYQAGEGLGGLEIWLKKDGALYRHYDVSASSGSFAIPLGSLPEGSWEVLVHTGSVGSASSLDIPTGSDLGLRRIDLDPSGWTSLGFLSSSGSRTNRGLECLRTPADDLEVPGFARAALAPFTLDALEQITPDTWRMAFPSKQDRSYVLKTSEDLVNWSALGTPVIGTGGFVTLQPQLQDPPPERCFFKIEELP